MKTKLLTAFLVLAVLVLGFCAVGFVRDKRIHNLNVFKPRLFGVVSSVDGTTFTLEPSAWVDYDQRLDMTGTSITLDYRKVIYPAGNMFTDGLSVGDEIYLVVDGMPYHGAEDAFDRIYFCIEYLK